LQFHFGVLTLNAAGEVERAITLTIACIYFGSAIKYSVLWMKYSQGLEKFRASIKYLLSIVNIPKVWKFFRSSVKYLPPFFKYFPGSRNI